MQEWQSRNALALVDKTRLAYCSKGVAINGHSAVAATLR